jgi:hypothetical protein
MKKEHERKSMSLKNELAKLGYTDLPTKIAYADCLEAVKQNGYALRYVNEQTDKICLEAVKQNGYALRYVKCERTD